VYLQRMGNDHKDREVHPLGWTGRGQVCPLCDICHRDSALFIAILAKAPQQPSTLIPRLQMAAELGAENASTDIIKRLEAVGQQSNPLALCKEAAEEIRRLRTKVRVLTDDLEAELKYNYG